MHRNIARACNYLNCEHDRIREAFQQRTSREQMLDSVQQLSDERTQVLVSLDSDDKVSSVRVSTGLTGP